MARWEPNASERLAVAALELFAERGYENTTVIDIAQRAGLTKSTFFRHFQDKREVLFGDGTMNGLLAEAIAAAPATATPLEAVAQALDAIGRRAFTPARRAFVARRRAVIAANPELQEREALKGLGLTASMTEALSRRGVPDLTASRGRGPGRARLEDRLRALERGDRRRGVRPGRTSGTRRSAGRQRPLLTRTGPAYARPRPLQLRSPSPTGSSDSGVDGAGDGGGLKLTSMVSKVLCSSVLA